MPSHRHSVLIVDDDTDILDAFSTSLTLADVITHAVSSGRDALELLEGGLIHPCAVFLDVRMPGLDGWQVWQEIRTAPAFSGLRVILVTAELPDRIRAAEAGLAGWLRKPVGVQELHAALARVCPAS